MAHRKAWSRSIRWRPPTGRLPLDVSPLNARIDAYRHGEPLDLRGPIFLAALALLLLDAMVVFWLSGGLSALRPRRRAAAAAMLAAGLIAALTLHDAGAARRPRRRSKPAATDSAASTTSP